MKQQVVTFETEDRKYSVTISEASVRMNLKRTLLIEEAQRVHDTKVALDEARSHRKKVISTSTDDAIQDQVDSIIRFFLYPSLVASVIHQEGFDHWPITFEEFCELPDQFEVLWEEATFEINPHWKPDLEMTDEERSELRKKAMSFISELDESSVDETITL